MPTSIADILASPLFTPQPAAARPSKTDDVLAALRGAAWSPAPAATSGSGSSNALLDAIATVQASRTGYSATPSPEAVRAVGGGGFASLVQGLLGERASAPSSAPNDSLPISAAELHGQLDGPALRLPSGVVVQKESVGSARVSGQELQDAVRGIVTLPEADQELLAHAGVQVHLLPVAGLEDNLLGATTIVQDQSTGAWKPTLVRVAVRAGLPGDEQTSEIVQHEIGHVVSVTRTQDRSERAAENYAHGH